MASVSPSTNIIVTMGRVLIKILGLYGLIYFNYSTSQIIVYTVLVTLAEGYELLAMFASSRLSAWQPVIYSAVTALNAGLLMALLYLTGKQEGQFALFGFMLVLASAIPGGFWGGLSAGVFTGLSYLVLDRFSSNMGGSFAMAPFFLIAGAVFGFVSEQRAAALRERDKLQEKSTRQNEVNRLKNEFISIASHNLRTPLTAISGYLELLTTKHAALAKDKEAAVLLDNMRQNITKLNQMLDSFLNMASLEEGRYKVTTHKADIFTVIDRAVESERGYAQQKGVPIEVMRPEKPLQELEIDTENLYHAITNILNNAIKFSKEQGQVIVEARQDRSQIIVSVKDEGVGMAEEAKNHIFQKFHRGTDILKYDYEGVGVGLYMAKLIVEAHGGKIWVESVPSKGTTVYFSLPLARVDMLVENL